MGKDDVEGRDIGQGLSVLREIRSSASRFIAGTALLDEDLKYLLIVGVG